MPPKKASKRSSDNDGDARIRNHVNRAGDADEENEYEHVKKGDDESIDDDASEVGWNSDDEHAFHKTTVYRNKKSSKRQDPDSEDDIDDDELLQNGGVLLSDLLFQNMGGDNNVKKSLKDESSDSEEDDESEEDDDEEGSEMEESDGDNSASGSEEDHPSSDEGDEDLDDVHNRLLSAIDRFSKPQESSEKTQAGKRHNHQNSAESAYSSLIDNGDVSMNALLGALDDTRGLSVVKKHLADLEKGLAAPVHVEKVVADRMERSQVYTGAQGDMNKWHSTVSSNRHATTLDLAKDKRQVRSFKSMVNRFVPTTDMEKEIQMVLVQHGATDEVNEQNEIDELQGRNLTLQEIREKQAELAKVKALMFYDQMKRHRMNKIKSKAYRKIQKKKKLKNNERNNQNNDDLDDEEKDAAREKDAFNRVKERMDMRHKNTSKWAKKALQYGHTDKSLRDAYHESVQLGHDLTQKMNEELRDDSHSVGSASEDDVGSGDEEKATGASARRAESNRASRAIESLLAENLGSSNADARAAVPDGRYKKLFEMDFMKRAAEQQKEKAREDAQSILREIEAMEEDYDSDLQADEAAEAAKKKGSQVSKERLSQAKEEVQSMFGGSGMAMRQGRRKGITVETSSSSSAPFEFASTGGDNEDEMPEYSDEEEHAVMEAALESNPWLQPVASISGSKKRKSTGTGAKASAGKDHEEVYINTLEIQTASNGKKNKNNQNTTQSTATTTSNKKNNKKKNQQTSAAVPVVDVVSGIVVETKDDSANNAKKEKAAVKISLSEGQTQADLVQMAFAGPDLEAEFHAYKKGEVDAELGLDEKRMKIISDVKAGWGDWAGPGAGGMQISQKVLNKRDKLITKVQNEHDLKVVNRKDSKMMNVMLSNRRIKTSSKYKISEIPHPYTSIEEYERSLQMPLGEEWNSTDVVKNYTQPEIKLRPGRVIEPIKLSKKRNNSSSTGGGTVVETRLNKPNKKAKK